MSEQDAPRPGRPDRSADVAETKEFKRLLLREDYHGLLWKCANERPRSSAKTLIEQRDMEHALMVVLLGYQGAFKSTLKQALSDTDTVSRGLQLRCDNPTGQGIIESHTPYFVEQELALFDPSASNAGRPVLWLIDSPGFEARVARETCRRYGLAVDSSIFDVLAKVLSAKQGFDADAISLMRYTKRDRLQRYLASAIVSVYNVDTISLDDAASQKKGVKKVVDAVAHARGFTGHTRAVNLFVTNGSATREQIVRVQSIVEGAQGSKAPPLNLRRYIDLLQQETLNAREREELKQHVKGLVSFLLEVMGVLNVQLRDGQLVPSTHKRRAAHVLFAFFRVLAILFAIVFVVGCTRSSSTA